MQRAVRLRSGDDFRRVRREGRSRANAWFAIVAARRPEGPGSLTRIGIVASKQVGGAVVRNRAKRRVRERIRVRYGQLLPGWDIVIVLRSALADVDPAALDDGLWSLLGRLSVVVVEAPCAVSPSG